MLERHLASAGGVIDEWVEKLWQPTWILGDFDLDHHFIRMMVMMIMVQ